jgi:hypothetical protein
MSVTIETQACPRYTHTMSLARAHTYTHRGDKKIARACTHMHALTHTQHSRAYTRALIYTYTCTRVSTIFFLFFLFFSSLSLRHQSISLLPSDHTPCLPTLALAPLPSGKLSSFYPPTIALPPFVSISLPHSLTLPPPLNPVHSQSQPLFPYPFFSTHFTSTYPHFDVLVVLSSPTPIPLPDPRPFNPTLPTLSPLIPHRPRPLRISSSFHPFTLFVALLHTLIHTRTHTTLRCLLCCFNCGNHIINNF